MKKNFIIFVVFILFISCSSNNSFKWDKENNIKAKNIGLTADEIMVLASLVEKETKIKDEKGKIASVFINRLKQDMLLQSDPSVKYAIGDTSLNRVLKQHIEIDSPYNTYKYKGLPPKPICEPSKETIEEVLNSERTDFIYFVYNSNLNGGFVYSTTYEEHIRNAQLYIEALNKKSE